MSRIGADTSWREDWMTSGKDLADCADTGATEATISAAQAHSDTFRLDTMRTTPNSKKFWHASILRCAEPWIVLLTGAELIHFPAGFKQFQTT
jgi:hypothetical protein